MKKVVVIGAGPAGIMAAIEASNKGNSVLLIDGNEKIGKKLFITGKGRCNVTNNRDISEFFDFIPGNPYFLYSSLYTFTNLDTINFFESKGIQLKVERGERMFPKSDKSSDILKGLNIGLKEAGVKVKLNSLVTDINVSKENTINYIEVNNTEKIYGDHFILATGGASYPLTGSRGDGQKFSKALGHNIVDLKPSLVPIEIKNSFIKELMGLSLRNIELTLLENNKKVYSGFGEMLFTHYGVSGPLVLKGSRYIKDKNYVISLDLKPALDVKALDTRVQNDFKKYINKPFKNALDNLLPKKLIPTVILLSNIDENKQVNEITKVERKNLVHLLKNFNLDVKGLRSLSEAIVTAGGVDTKEIDPSTMKSKLISNLSFAGEVIDVDAFTGGYNVQVALSTGYIAGSNI
ncbi:NAD(P)/FAD-dependent oxidoreductase [uncultured Clostridium sp.]|uniref:NAD(P)/FAD-dependent oxidoreductase n=1 Tax=uncultured Clostridium sp. TaxID=59620 RepID=UPI002623596B|nr:NAD(P)/FAD-dependent oxidoreductase [uncultured Clostridium sp.]